MVVFYPEGYDPAPLFADMEADNDIRYVPVNEHGTLEQDVTIYAGESVYFVGKGKLNEYYRQIYKGLERND